MGYSRLLLMLLCFQKNFLPSEQQYGSGSSYVTPLNSQANDTPDTLDICETLYLLNVVPYPDNHTFAGWDKGFELIPAGHLATRHINNNSNILPGYKLEVIDVASEACGKSIIIDGLVEFYKHLLDPVRTCVFGVVGLYCSTVTNTIAPLADYPQIGHIVLAASTSPEHRDVTALPHTFHTIASSRVFNEAMITMMNALKWRKINIVHDSLGVYFKSTANDFVQLINSNLDKQLTSKIPIQPQQTSVSDVFDIINDEEARVGYFSVTEGEGAALFCEAYRRQFLWPGYVYFLHERSLAQILSTQVDCSQEELTKALEGVFLFQYRLFVPQNYRLYSGVTYEQYHKAYLQELDEFAGVTGMELDDNVYANTLYDQVWAFALAANKSLGMVNFSNTSITANTVRDKLMIREVLTRKMMDIEFDGASGFIKFGERQEVLTSVEIYQVRNGTQELIGIYNAYNKSIYFLSNFNRDMVPGDTFDLRYQLVPRWVGIVMVICNAMLFLLILFNTVSIVCLKNQPEIKSGSYYLSMSILAGCYILCLSPLLQTILASFVITKPIVFSVLCNLEFWFFISGINVVFVTLLLRLLRIFHVFRSYHSTGKHWSDRYILLYITLACSVMAILLGIWTAVDPLHYFEERTYIPSSQPPHYVVRSYCSSNFLGICLGFSFSLIGLVMISVIFLAIQTWHIKRKHYKDTKKVNMFIFSVCIVYAVFIPLWLILSAVRIDTWAYVCKCVANLGGAALCQIFLFLPKIVPTLYYKWNLKPPAVKDFTIEHNKFTYSSSCNSL